jgi:hypothetical protein
LEGYEVRAISAVGSMMLSLGGSKWSIEDLRPGFGRRTASRQDNDEGFTMPVKGWPVCVDPIGAILEYTHDLLSRMRISYSSMHFVLDQNHRHQGFHLEISP